MCDKCGKYEPTTPDKIYVVNLHELVLRGLKRRAIEERGRKLLTPDIPKNLEIKTGD